MSRAWSCNEWDPLEEVIVGNPLRARFPDGGSEYPTRRVSRPPDRGDTPGPLPAKDHRGDGRGSGRVRRRPDGPGHRGQTPGDLAARGQVLHHPLGIPGLLQLLPARHPAGHRGPDHRNTQCHSQSRPGELQLPRSDGRLPEVGRTMVRRSQTHASGLAVRGRPEQAHASQRRAGVRCGERLAFGPGSDLPGERHGQRAGGPMAADDPGRDVQGSLPQGRLLRQPHRLDARGLAARPDALQSRPESTARLCPGS